MAHHAQAPTPVVLSDTVQRLPDNLWMGVNDLIKKHQPVNLATGFPDFHEVVPQARKTWARGIDDESTHMKSQLTTIIGLLWGGFLSVLNS